MEWFVDDPKRGQTALTIIAFVLTVGGIWFGRKRLSLAIPAALVFLLLAAIAIPGAIPVRSATQRSACINNLKWIQSAKTEWANENKKVAGDIPAEADVYRTKHPGGVVRHRPYCPRGGTYTIGAVGQNPTCSLSNKGHRLE